MRSGREHCHPALAVEVLRGTLRSGAGVDGAAEEEDANAEADAEEEKEVEGS